MGIFPPRNGVSVLNEAVGMRPDTDTERSTEPLADVPPAVERGVRVFNEHDAEGVLAEFADGGTFTDPLLDEELAGADLRAYLEETYEAFPDLRLDARRVIAADDGAVAIEATYRGTHEGRIQGVPATGREVAISGVSVIDVDADGITAWRDYFDQQAFAEQLGLTFPDVVPLLPRLAVAKLKERA